MKPPAGGRWRESVEGRAAGADEEAREDRLRKMGKVPRYFTENPHVGWTLMAATLIIGALGYVKMPKRKDPFIKVRAAVAVCAWPGASAEKVEALLTHPIEETIAQSPDVEKIESTSRTGASIVVVTLRESLPLADIPATLDDLDFRLRSIQGLPEGATPVQFQKDFGDTASLVLTVASPRVGKVELALRARAIARALEASRRGKVPPHGRGVGGARGEGTQRVAGAAPPRSALIFNYPLTLDPGPLRRMSHGILLMARAHPLLRDVEEVEGSGFFAIDAIATRGAAAWAAFSEGLRVGESRVELHPDMWSPVVVEDADPGSIAAALAANPGDAYSYRQLDELSGQMARRLRGLSTVAKVTRAGLLEEKIYLDYSQERLAALGLNPAVLLDAISARNAQAPGGMLDAYGRTVAIDTTGEYRSEKDIGDTLIATGASGAPVFVRDVVDVRRDYDDLGQYLNTLSVREAGGGGELRRTRAVTLALQMRAGEQIERFSEQVDGALTSLRETLPDDLRLERTSDQAQQVAEKIDLFMTSLFEALAIIIAIGFIGFRDWRSGLILAISVPLTLAMTFIFMVILGIDIQQISLGGLILSLGLLVDDPVVASDAIQHELDAGRPRGVASWLGPTRLGRAILFATITNIVAYLPFLLYRGDLGHFIYSLPVVLTCSLVASRIVSMTFIPLLGHAILRRRRVPLTSSSAAPSSTLMELYCRVVSWAIANRYRVLAGSLVFMVAGLLGALQLRISLFPKDTSRLFYIDVFLPEDASLRMTNEAAVQTEAIVRRVANDYGQSREGGVGGGLETGARILPALSALFASSASSASPILHSVTTFIGGAAPRFWYSVSPEHRQANYAQLLVKVEDARDTRVIVPLLQDALTSGVPGARIDVRELEDGRPTPRPVEVRFSGDEVGVLRSLAAKAKRIFENVAIAERVRDDWGENGFHVGIGLDSTKAGLSGVTTADVARSAAEGFSGGAPINVLREGERSIPIAGRLRREERSAASDVDNLYVFSARGAKVPIAGIASVSYRYQLERIQHRAQRRTISVSCFPSAGRVPAEVMREARAQLTELRAKLPPGYDMTIGGAEEDVGRVLGESLTVGLVSVVAIFLALVIQLRNALKPLIVLTAVPFGMCGAILSLGSMGSVFSFMAILGVISLLGVIVSHVIVLFDAIEDLRGRGVALERALLEAGRQRVRPVLITTAATALGLVPLVIHGGPLWEPLCFAQIGGLTLATGITLFLVPTLYAVFVIDLEWIRWETRPQAPTDLPLELDLDVELELELDVEVEVEVERAHTGRRSLVGLPSAPHLLRRSG